MAVYRHQAGSVILLEDELGRIAMQLRDDKPGLPGRNCWGLFGGLIDDGETPTETILREVEEELAVQLSPKKLTHTRSWYIGSNDLTTHIYHYHVEHELDNAILGEGQKWAFMAYDDLHEQPISLHQGMILVDFWREYVPEEVSVVLLETSDGKIAMQHRDDKPNLAGRNQWTPFGGHLEKDESPIDGAVREIQEELAIMLEPEKLEIVTTQIRPDNVPVHVFRYDATDLLDDAVLCEGQAWAILSPDEIRQKDLVPRYRHILERYWLV